MTPQIRLALMLVNETPVTTITCVNNKSKPICPLMYEIKRAPHVLPNNRQEDDWLKSESNTRDNLKGQYPFKQMYKLPKLN